MLSTRSGVPSGQSPLVAGAAVGRGSVPVPRGEPVLSASVGLARYEPGDTVDGVLAAADAAMYVEKARRRGREVGREVRVVV